MKKQSDAIQTRKGTGQAGPSSDSEKLDQVFLAISELKKSCTSFSDRVVSIEESVSEPPEQFADDTDSIHDFIE